VANLTYIILAAGEGKKMHPLTLKCPKTMFRLDENYTIIKRLIRQIRVFDDEAEIVVVVGFMSEIIKSELEMENIIFINNPFYKTTKSSASLWFAGEYLNRDNVILLNSDVVLSDDIMRNVVCQETEKPFLLIDKGSIAEHNYNVHVEGEKVIVIGCEISSPIGRYCNVIKFDGISARELYEELNDLMEKGMYNHHYEDIITQMIFASVFEMYYKNIENTEWAEIDSVDDLIKARNIKFLHSHV